MPGKRANRTSEVLVHFTGNPTYRDLETAVRSIADLRIKLFPFTKLTWSKSLKVIPEETARHKKQPDLPGEPLVVLPAIVKHPVRSSGDKEKVAYRDATGDGVVL
jgi:hypothetical protein